MASGPAVDVYDDGYLHVEHARHYVVCGGEPVFHLSRKEFLILSRLVRDPGRPVTHLELWDYAWGDGKEFNNGTFRTHICNLRRKLAPYGIDIVPIIHVGYRFSHAAAPANEDLR